MFKNAGKLGRDAGHAADRDAQLAVVDGAAPGGSPRNVEECPLRVEHDGYVVVRRIAKIADEVLILGVERGQQVAAEGLGSVFAFEVEVEVAAFALRKIGFGAQFALGAGKILAGG